MTLMKVMIITVFKGFTVDFDVSIQKKIYNVNIITQTSHIKICLYTLKIQ